MAGIPENPIPEIDNDLKRALGPFHLIALGIGAIIGAGIFVITGHAAATFAGPAVVISFAIAGTGCLFAGLCYAEYAAMIPVAGSAYTYTYATLGRFMAWFIGWNLVLEYLAASSTVAVGWSGYFSNLMTSIGHPIATAFSSAPICFAGDPLPCPQIAAGAAQLHHVLYTGTYFNLPAVALIALITFVLVVGVNMSANFNNAMVSIKLLIVVLVIGFAFSHVVPANHMPFIPDNTGTFGQFGWTGIFRATGVIFFAYIGFDAVSVAAQEAKNPQRDIPLGILGSLAICTVLYMLMSWVLTGLASYTTLNVAYPVSMAVEAIPSTRWLAPYVNVGAVVGLASVVLVLLLGQSRIFYAMAKDGMVPPTFSAIHPRFRTPWKGTIITGLFAAILAGILPLDILGELVSIGTLLAFVIVCAGVMVLRRRRPNVKRPFRTPLVWIVAPLGIAMCAFMMAFLPMDTWIRLGVWTVIGLIIYAVYSRYHAMPPRWKLVDEPAPPAE
ncbi:MAG TPA: amino acid permease [Rhizomicrobium sp.]|jgi:APA family basic amino acid/polyamine antiporter|nr:amino acid permease [Rhizomicrobium sp.]